MKVVISYRAIASKSIVVSYHLDELADGPVLEWQFLSTGLTVSGTTIIISLNV